MYTKQNKNKQTKQKTKPTSLQAVVLSSLLSSSIGAYAIIVKLISLHSWRNSKIYSSNRSWIYSHISAWESFSPLAVAIYTTLALHW